MPAPLPAGEHTESARLALAVLELRKTLEGNLRTLTSVQTLVERIRTGESNRESDLLLGEISRLMRSTAACSGTLAAQCAATLAIVGELQSALGARLQ